MEAVKHGTIKSVHGYYVSLPSAEAHHQTHLTGVVFGMTQKVHPRLVEDSSAKRSLEFPKLNEHLITLSCMSYVVTVPQTPMIMPIILPLLISRIIIFRKLNACCSYPNWIKKIQVWLAIPLQALPKDHGEIKTEVNDTKPEYLMSSLLFLGFKGSRCEYESRQVVLKLWDLLLVGMLKTIVDSRGRSPI